jgi:lysophospholipase L1-like esterase
MTGSGFEPTDTVNTSGITCPATVQSNNALQFVLPKVSGGMQLVQVARTDGTTSNRASIYVSPLLDSAHNGERHMPGSRVRLRGSGFAHGMQVQVNGQDMPDALVTDPETIEFRLVRPSTVTPNASGEIVTVRVVLADAGPASASNTITILLDTFRILAFGDSIMWGQGLEEPDKCHSLVEQAIRQRHGGIGVYKDVRAHSGACLEPRAGGTAYKQRLDGEVPTSYPTIRDQVLEFEDVPDANEDVDLILLDGGINDVNVRTILSPLTSGAQLTTDIKTYCHDSMLNLLKELTSKFQKARIIVTGYYQILSNESNLAFLDAFMFTTGLDLGSIPGAIVAGVATPEILEKISGNCALFTAEANHQLQLAVAEANAALAQDGDARVAFADPKFSPANAAMAPDAFVYGIHLDLSPEDPESVAGPRSAACEMAGSAQTDVAVCKRASVGHPNPRGAQAYASAVVALL